MARKSNDDPFNGLGAPLSFYSKGEPAWPPAWKLPDLDDDDQDVFGKFAYLADDLVLRTAVNIWDNGLRLPGAFEGITGGLLSAHARLVIGTITSAGALEQYDLEKAADAVREAWIGMARQAVRLSQDDGEA